MSTSTSNLQFDSAPNDAASWKDEVNARLAAHRTRRPRPVEGQTALPGFEPKAENPGGRRQSPPKSVAARVAERYSKAPSYSDMIAAHAAAARAAEVAAAAAAEAHATTQAMLAGFERETQEEVPGPTLVEIAQEPESPVYTSFSVSPSSLIVEAEPVAELIPEVIEDPFAPREFSPVQPLPAKLLEFPRELIAARKARPRHAEGPLREEAEHDGSQLRIFEVEPETISKEPVIDPVLPEWHSIRLDNRPRPEFLQEEEVASAVPAQHRRPEQQHLPAPFFDLPLQIAPLQDRLMSAIVDGALATAAFFVFVLVFVACTKVPPTGKLALAGGAIALGGIFVLYQWLFFAFSDATPGMRYARIALCTFDDDNPTRKVTRNRVGALLLSALPMGLGFLWTLFDDDHLGWHDRITRTYQRSYR